MYKKNIKPFFPGTSRNIILIFLVIGIGAFFYGFDKDVAITVLGLIIFLISVFIVTGRYGIQINFKSHRYRSFLSFIYILQIGSWKEMPRVKEISLIPEKRFIARHTLKNNLYTETFLIKMIRTDKEEPLTVSRGLYGELLLEAEDLAKKLNVSVKEF
jgi:hypothetical protein